MKDPDKLPVLTFPPKAAQRQATTRQATDPDTFARAIAALQSALEAEVAKPRPDPEPDLLQDDSFSPVGAPTWRAGHRSKTNTTSGRQKHPATNRKMANSGPATDRQSLTRRITAIHLPRFAIERWQRWAAQQPDTPPEDVPMALAVEGHHGPVIYATNRAAEQAGVHIDARVVDARALIPDLRVEFGDVDGDTRALNRLMLWCRRWCPWTVVDGPNGLVMDTTGSDHLWGGEAAMLREIEERLAHLGLSANLATAPTHGAAWALARFGNVRHVALAETLTAEVAPLPVRALRLKGDTILLLKRLGLKTIGDLAAVPRASLARRFNQAELVQNPLLRLDQMIGRLAEPVNAPDDPPRFAVQAQLAEPVQDPTPHLPALCRELCQGMNAEGFGARRITVTVYRTDGEVRHITVATARASRDADHLVRLFDDKLDSIDPGFGFDLITLGATVVEEISIAQTRLDGSIDDGAELARLIDRLTARLGTKSIRVPETIQSHVPERAQVDHPAMVTAPKPASPVRDRPIRLFDPAEEIRVVYAVPEGPPAQFIWRRLTHRVIRFAGPERIAPEWWCDKPSTRLRDYYRIEDQTGKRFWIYRNGVLGDRRGATPRWFVHGVFG